MSYTYINTFDALQGDRSFSAVSYVWDQCNDITILESKLRNMVALINNVDVTKEIWLDRVSNRQKGVNLEYGIKNMNKIYALAKVTFVIIPELEEREIKIDNIELQSPGWLEKLQAIHNYHLVSIIVRSMWFRRAWTFQEQILSNKLVIQVDNKVVDITSIVHGLIVLNIHGVDIRAYRENSILFMCNKKNINENITKREIRNMFKYDNDITTTCGIEIAELYHEDDLSTLRKKCYNSKLTIIDALSLVSDRVMGAENTGYEPIASLLKPDYQNMSNANNVRKIPLSAILTYEQRNNTLRNMHWLPKRLNTNNEIYSFNRMLSVCDDNHLVIDGGEFYISHDMQHIYFRAGTTLKEGHLYIELSVQKIITPCSCIHHENVNTYIKCMYGYETKIKPLSKSFTVITHFICVVGEEKFKVHDVMDEYKYIYAQGLRIIIE